MNIFIELLLHGIIASISTFGFALFMHTPKKQIIYASLTGGFGWVLYTFLSRYGVDAVMSSFLAACLVGLFGEIFARKLRAPSIVFIIPGMLPLVPGRGLYYTMENLIAKNYMSALSFGTTTLSVAGAISLGIILVTSSARTLSIERYKKALKK